MFAQQNPGLASYDAAMPWNSVLLAAWDGTRQARFWDNIKEQRLDMELKVRIMLKLKAEEGYSDFLGIPTVPIRPGNESDQ